eukprot:GILK01003158.1.p1 GENE.GILK01003158.1~~GILK01003158.1.p1  ORF type:complete len:316 (+),score=39.29 GILK01003158.1:42-950(+)
MALRLLSRLMSHGWRRPPSLCLRPVFMVPNQNDRHVTPVVQCREFSRGKKLSETINRNKSFGGRRRGYEDDSDFDDIPAIEDVVSEDEYENEMDDESANENLRYDDGFEDASPYSGDEELEHEPAIEGLEADDADAADTRRPERIYDLSPALGPMASPVMSIKIRNEIYKLYKEDPVTNSFEALAEKYNILPERVRALVIMTHLYWTRSPEERNAADEFLKKMKKKDSVYHLLLCRARVYDPPVDKSGSRYQVPNYPRNIDSDEEEMPPAAPGRKIRPPVKEVLVKKEGDFIVKELQKYRLY